MTIPPKPSAASKRPEPTQSFQFQTVTEKLPPKPSAASKRPAPTQKPTEGRTMYTLTETLADTTTDLYDSYDTVTESRGDD